MHDRPRTELVLVCGMARATVAAVAEETRRAAPSETVALAYDLRAITEGVVIRTLRDRRGTTPTVLELAHGCVTCTLRDDVLPLLHALGDDQAVRRVVLVLDPGMEPESVCDALAHLLAEGHDAPVTEKLRLRGVVSVLDAAAWLDDAGSDEALAERGAALAEDDERTVAQIVVGQAEFADVLVLAGPEPEPWTRVRRDAVLARLAPQAVQVDVADARVLDVAPLLDALPAASRGDVPHDPHASLLRGQPPLTRDVGVSLLHVEHRRPFHPQRLHDAVDALLTGTVRVRGRVWLASQPEHVLWVESAGPGLQIGRAGRWLAAEPPTAWDDVAPERAAAASLRWHERFGDREQQLLVLAHEADPAEIVAALDAALLTDDELAAGEDAWRRWPDPFGFFHTDPCPDLPGTATGAEATGPASTDDHRGGQP